MASRIYDYTPDQLQKLLDESNGYADVLRKLKMNSHGANPSTLKRIISEYKLDETKLNENRHNLFTRCSEYANKVNVKYLLEDILNGKHPGYHSSKLLERLIEAGYKEEKCECCGIISWMDKSISFHLHHKDGDHDNNQLDNLQVLCPNCHSQTDTFAGKNVNKKKKHKNKKENKTTPYGVTEDGLKFYDGNKYRILCPECQITFMNKEANKCRKCYDKERRKPKVTKEVLFEIIKPKFLFKSFSFACFKKASLTVTLSCALKTSAKSNITICENIA